LHAVDGDLLVAINAARIDRGEAAYDGHAGTGDSTLLGGCACCVHGVHNATLLLFHFGLGRATHLTYRHATNQLRQPLLQLLAVVVAGGLVDLAADFLYAAFDLGMLALTFHDGGVVLVDGNLLSLAEVRHLHVLQLDAQIFGDGLSAGEDRDVLQHGLAAIAEARRLYGAD